MFGQQKIGLVLGGGGGRGFFHMGVIKALQELGVKIEEISGTSIGAVVGLMYAANPKIDFEAEAQGLDFFKVIQMIALGLNKKSFGPLEDFLKSYIKVEDFKELKIKCRFNASDINSNEEVVFENGKIFPAILGSIAIPGIFPPLAYENRYLVDGGIVNNLPINLISKANKIIASDISSPGKRIDEKSSIIDVLTTAMVAMQISNSLEKAKKMRNKKIIYLSSAKANTAVLDFRKKNYQHLIDLGYQSIMEKKKEIL